MYKLLFFLLIIIAEQSFGASLSLDLGESQGNLNTKIIELIALITVISLAPSILIMVTSFTRIIIILSFTRSAIGLQQTPPNAVIISLALFLTGFIMMPSFEKSYQEGIHPYLESKINETIAWEKSVEPFKEFMLRLTRDRDLELFASAAKLPENVTKNEVGLHILIPAFMISELKRAFEIGFLIFLPFLIIDMLVASILMAMGMMMVPPNTISLPFKLIFFVSIDGWYMLSGSLIKSFGV